MTYFGLFPVQLCFSTYTEYRNKKVLISKLYSQLDYKAKQIYKLYVFSRCLIKEKQKETIWFEINFRDWLYEGNNERND